MDVRNKPSPLYRVTHLGGNARYEALDVQLSRARLLAGRVGALQTARRFPQSAAFAQRRVLDVVEVFAEIRRSACLR